MEKEGLVQVKTVPPIHIKIGVLPVGRDLNLITGDGFNIIG